MTIKCDIGALLLCEKTLVKYDHLDSFSIVYLDKEPNLKFFWGAGQQGFLNKY